MQLTDILLWHIYHSPHCHHTDPIKPKFVVTVGFEANYVLGFLINSRSRPYITNNPHLAACETEILEVQHRLLTRDSYVDCGNPYPFRAWDFDRSKCLLSAEAKADVLIAVRACPVLKIKHKRMILENGGEQWELPPRDDD